MNNYKSPLTEINKDSTPLRKTRSARPQEGWVNPLFRGKDYSGPKEYRDPNDEQGWTLMEKIQQIVGTKDFKIFGENKWAGFTGLTHDQYFQKYGKHHNSYTTPSETPPPSSDPGDVSDVDENILSPGDGWQYQKIDDNTYKTKRVVGGNWTTVTPTSPESWGFKSIQKMFAGVKTQKVEEWERLGYANEAEYLEYKQSFKGAQEPWERLGYSSKEEYDQAMIEQSMNF